MCFIVTFCRFLWHREIFLSKVGKNDSILIAKKWVFSWRSQDLWDLLSLKLLIFDIYKKMPKISNENKKQKSFIILFQQTCMHEKKVTGSKFFSLGFVGTLVSKSLKKGEKMTKYGKKLQNFRWRRHQFHNCSSKK